MSDKPKRRDFYSGIPWVNVTAQEAHAHPLGKLGPIEWTIAIYFIAISILKFWLAFDYGYGFGVAFLNSIWPFLVGLGLAFRVPWSVIMAMVSTALTAYALVRGLGGGGDLITLFEMIASVGILFYLIDADRPNLIYRHRYRKYSVEDDNAG